VYHLHSEDIGCQSMRLKAPVSKAAILPAFDFARAAKGPSIRNICPPKITSDDIPLSEPTSSPETAHVALPRITARRWGGEPASVQHLRPGSSAAASGVRCAHKLLAPVRVTAVRTRLSVPSAAGTSPCGSRPAPALLVPPCLALRWPVVSAWTQELQRRHGRLGRPYW
jgi:hypothetical protein